MKRAMNDARDSVLIDLEYKARGFKNRLAFRRWCRGNSVPLLKDGRRLWVRPADVDAVLARLHDATASTNKTGAPATGDAEGVPKTESELAAEAAFQKMLRR